MKYDPSAPRPWLQGAKNPKAILTEEAVRAIRNSSLSLRDLAKEYGVSVSTVSRIKANKIWKYI